MSQSESIPSSKNVELKKWSYLLGGLIVLQALSAALYLGRAGQFGFPLDDAWIHQTYARNLGLHGTMAFNPGQPSSGSTSFGWTLLLAAGYWLQVPFFSWTYLWGSLFAVAAAFTAARLSDAYFGNLRNAVIAGVLCILEWHLAWASVSGMEIGLFTFLTLLFFLLIRRNTSPFFLGVLTGIVVLVRPEGMILVLVYGVHLLIHRRGGTRLLLVEAAPFALALVLIVAPWMTFNWIYSHRPFPNTISAKFMQYGYPWSIWKSLKYFWDVLIYFINGPLLLLIPGAALALYRAWKAKAAQLFHPWVWALTLIVLYAAALPVIYDQGRYLMPLIPLFVIYGLEGFSWGLNRFLHSPPLRSAVWFSLFGMTILLWINGAADYAYRIQLYSNVHLQAAEWIDAHTAPDAVLATHDIGILAYHTGRQIVDLAGLVTPEIVPIMRDPAKMAAYLRLRHVRYLAVYSGYYRELLTSLDAHVVFSPDAEQLRAMGIEPFEIYEVNAR